VPDPIDTSARARDHLDRLYRAMTPREKLLHALALTETANLFALAGLRARFPRDDERQLRRRLAERTLGRELFAVMSGRSASDP